MALVLVMYRDFKRSWPRAWTSLKADMYLLDHAWLVPVLPLGGGEGRPAFRTDLGRVSPLHTILGVSYGAVHSALLAGGILGGGIASPSPGSGGRFYQMTVDWFVTDRFRFEAGVLIAGVGGAPLHRDTGGGPLIRYTRWDI